MADASLSIDPALNVKRVPTVEKDNLTVFGSAGVKITWDFLRWLASLLRTELLNEMPAMDELVSQWQQNILHDVWTKEARKRQPGDIFL